MSTASIVSTDALGMLGQLQFDAWTSSATTSGAKLTAVVFRDEVDWSEPVDFDNGTATLSADSVTWGSSVLNYCQLIARSELGYFFADASGRLTYRDRTVTGDAIVAGFGDAPGPLRDDDGNVLYDDDGAMLLADGSGIRPVADFVLSLAQPAKSAST